MPETPTHRLYARVGVMAPKHVGLVKTRYGARQMAAGYRAALVDFCDAAPVRFELLTHDGRTEAVEPLTVEEGAAC